MKKGGPDRPVSNNEFSSVTLNEMGRKPEGGYFNFEFEQSSRLND